MSDKEHVKELIKQSILFTGAALVDILQPMECQAEKFKCPARV